MGDKSERGRPPANLPAKAWGAYVDAIREVRPGPGLEPHELFEFLCREHPSAIPDTLESFRRILSGNRGARPGFPAAMAAALRLSRFNLDTSALDLDPDEFKVRLERDPPSSLADVLRQGQDGTRIELKPRSAMLTRRRHFGAQIEPVASISAHVPHYLLIRRAREATGIDGFLLLLGHGLADRKWQLVSSITDRPHSPAVRTQWSSIASDISMTAPPQDGEFVLYAVGSPIRFSEATIALFQSLVDTDAFLDERQISRIAAEVSRVLGRGGWSSALHYTTG
jgi:hypothetical protein